nr:hypothetical protein BaRGS_000901 [Batillaria attramentaria]
MESEGGLIIIIIIIIIITITTTIIIIIIIVVVVVVIIIIIMRICLAPNLLLELPAWRVVLDADFLRVCPIQRY